jgi:cytochrome c oxidase assembly factor CtaG
LITTRVATTSSLGLVWHADPLVLSGLAAATTLWWLAARRVPSLPRSHTRWAAVALVAAVVALVSPLATLAEERFAWHMVQHLLLTYAVAPALALAAPVTLLLQAVSPAVRRRRLLPLLHSAPVRFLSHLVVAWVIFAAVMYLTHFSSLYDAALTSSALHGLEHALYLGAAVLFWWPVVRRDPVPGRVGWPARLLYLVLAMPLQSLLGVAITFSDTVLYDRYRTLLGPARALADQQLAGTVMWVGGDLLMLAAVGCGIAAWMRVEARETARLDARLDAARAAAAGRPA